MIYLLNTTQLYNPNKDEIVINAKKRQNSIQHDSWVTNQNSVENTDSFKEETIDNSKEFEFCPKSKKSCCFNTFGTAVVLSRSSEFDTNIVNCGQRGNVKFNAKLCGN